MIPAWLPGAVALAVLAVGIARVWWKGLPDETHGKAGDGGAGSGGAGL